MLIATEKAAWVWEKGRVTIPYRLVPEVLPEWRGWFEYQRPWFGD